MATVNTETTYITLEIENLLKTYLFREKGSKKLFL